MPKCDLLAECRFVSDRMKKLAATAEALKRSFCLGSFTRCACYMVAKELGRAPENMFPHQTDQAREIVRKAHALRKRKRGAADDGNGIANMMQPPAAREPLPPAP